MDREKLLKNRLQDSIDFAVGMNEDLDSVSWNYQEGILLSCNEAKLVIELINKLTIPVVVLQSEQLFCVVDYFGNFTKGKEYLCKPEGKKHFEVCDNFGVWYSVNRKCFNKNNCTNKSPK
jgi:hypothetical protein